MSKILLVLEMKMNEILFNATATTLDKAGASSTWQPLQWEPAQRLAIRQLMLGHTAQPDEFNVIEVSAKSELNKKNEFLKINMIFSDRLRLHL